jgi:hypothetical protein
MGATKAATKAVMMDE